MDELTPEDVSHLLVELARRIGDEEDDGGPEPVMTSRGYVDLWRDGDIVAHGVLLLNLNEVAGG